MSLARIFVRRLSIGFLAIWSILSIIFGLFTLTDDWVLERELAPAAWAGEQELLDRTRQEYLAERGLDSPVHELYLDYMTDIFVMDWGESFLTGQPALQEVIDASLATATYAIPAVIVAIALGITIGVIGALNPDSRLAGSSIWMSYLLFAIPSFWLGGLILSFSIEGTIGHPDLLYDSILPFLFTTAALLGGYVSYARAHSMEYASADFVKLVRAKGASNLRVATHVTRNSAIPFVSMLFTEALGLLVLAIFVIEVLFGIEGLGLLMFDSINHRDLPVLVGGIIVIILVSVVGNIIQDVSYTMLDPRVDTGARDL